MTTVEPDSAEPKAAALAISKDPVLMTMVQMVNKMSSIGPSVTLTVKGLMITGELMPNWLWMKAQADLSHEAHVRDDENAGEERVGMAMYFDHLMSLYKPDPGEEEKRPTGFIHLSNAKIFSGNGFNIPGNEVHWRGSLDEIDGWMFGRIS